MLYRNIRRPYAIMKNGYYLWFEFFHDFVINIRTTKDINYAFHYETKEQAERFMKINNIPGEIIYAPAND